MLYQLAGYVSGVLIIVSFFPYIQDIFKHKTNPQRASWLIWAILGAIAFFSQLAKGATHSLWFTGLQELGDLSIFLLSIKYGLGGLAKRDIIALLGAGVSLILWYLTKEPATALFIIIFIDGIGGVLTMLKSYEHPKTETMLTYTLTSISGFFGCVAVGKLNFILLAFPLYVCLISLSIVIAIRLGLRRSFRFDQS